MAAPIGDSFPRALRVRPASGRAARSTISSCDVASHATGPRRQARGALRALEDVKKVLTRRCGSSLSSVD